MLPFYEKTDIQYPPIMKSCAEVYLKYLADLLYPPLSVDERYKRLILSNIQSGEDTASRYNIDKFKKTNLVYPFTAYNIQEQEIDEKRKNHFGKSRNRFVEALNAYLTVIPYTVEIPLISFYTTPTDYLRARSILQLDAASLTRFYLPVMINGVRARTVFNVDFPGPTKGQYAFEFDEYLTKNKIYDIVHTVKLEYSEIIIEPKDIFPVETKELELVPLTDEASLVGQDQSVPSILSVSVESDATNVPLQPIQITFSEEMADDESIISQSIYFTPETEIEYAWNTDKTILSVQPVGGFVANTLYVLEVLPFLVSKYYVSIKEGLLLNFKTGAS